MKKLILILFIPVLMFGQIKYRLLENHIIENDDTVYTEAFPIYYDTLQACWAVTADSIDMDVYFQYSVAGANWNTSAKEADIVLTAAADTAIKFGVDEPAFYGRLMYIFAASGNDVDTSGYLETWMKLFKTQDKPNY